MPETEQALDTRATISNFIDKLASGSKEDIELNVARREASINSLIPGFSLLKGCEQGMQHHQEGNALVHTAKVFSNAALLTSHLPIHDRYVVLVAALVHDIEKPSTRAEDGGKVTFYRHAEKAADRCSEFAKRFHLTPSEADQLDFLVRYHMAAHLMPQFGEKSRLEIYQSPHFSDLMILQEADALSSWRNSDGSQHGDVLREFYLSDRTTLFDKASASALQELLYKNATEELKSLGVSPGPYFGQVRKALQSVALHSAEEARTWARKYFEEHPPIG